MKKLNELYPGQKDCAIKGIKINSKEIEPGDLFVCTMGVTTDRHDFIDEAIEKGASAVVVSRDVGEKKVPLIHVENTNEELKTLTRRFYDAPDEKLLMIGITGTNGKTTVAELIYQLLGKQCAYLGTNGIKCHQFEERIRNTTPDVDRLYLYMDRFVKAGCKVLSMETSSEAFFRHRLDLIQYDLAVLTNITEDHLNIHKTLENYIDCKCQLFRQVKEDGIAILNSSDSHFEQVKACCHCQVLTYGYREEDTLRILNSQETKEGITLDFVYRGKTYHLESPLGGSFNALNLSAVILVGTVFSLSISKILIKLSKIRTIAGRMEKLEFGQPYQIILDYAHTPDALDKILSYLNQIKTGRIITLTGSAGGREKEKRPAMGKIVLEKSDFVIFTMDDPREEDVNQIIDDLIGDATATNYIRIPERKKAIFKALEMAQKNDIVVLAGKGRDNYMAIGKEYLPYSDYEVVEAYFKKVNK